MTTLCMSLAKFIGKEIGALPFRKVELEELSTLIEFDSS